MLARIGYEVIKYGNTLGVVQWASPKTRIPYDFSSYVGRTELDI